MTVPTLGEFVNFEDILADELNVKKVIQGDTLALDFELTPALKREGLMREIVRHVQSARKDAGLNVDDRIKLGLRAAGTLAEAISEHQNAIAVETLASSVGAESYAYTTTVKVEDENLIVTLEKA